MLSILSFAALLLAAPAQTLPTPSPVPAAASSAVAFQRLEMLDPAGPAVEIGVWSPAAAYDAPRPLIVISHGNGGDFRSHETTARALASAGFVVAALTHTGDNWRDQSRATDVAQRPRQLSLLIDYMLTRWEGRDGLDPERVGAFGFSAGGFTVLAAAGGRPDLTRVIRHCRDHPDFYDCRLIGSAGAATRPTAPQVWSHDTRIHAVVVAAPALGFTFGAEGLAQVTQPVQLWRGGDDQILPSPYYAEPVRDGLPTPPDYHVVEGAGHFDFLPVCSDRLAALAPAICTAAPGFDRAAFQARFAREVVGFFRRSL